MNVFEIQGPDGKTYEVEAETIEQAAQAVSSMGSEKKSWGQVLKENLLGDNDDTTHNFGEKVGSFLNKAGESLTFGLVGDEASAAAAGLIPGGMDYDERLALERQNEAVFERDNPGAAFGAEVGGAVAGALLPLGAMGTLARGAKLAPRIGASVGTGAASAGTYGFMEGEGLQGRLDGAKSGATLGGVVGGAVPVAGAGVQKVADALVGRRAIRRAASGAPSTAALKAEGRANYKAIEDAGVSINPDSFARKSGEIIEGMKDAGLDDATGALNLTPKSARIAQLLTEATDGANTLPFNKVDQLRRKASIPASSLDNKVEQGLGSKVISDLDEYMRNLTDADVDAGDIETLKTMLPKARETWARMSRSQKVDDAMDAAENYASGKASGLANQFKKILKDPRGFSDAEIKMLRRVVDGTMPEKIVRYMGSGLGMMGQVGMGAASGSALGPLGTIAGTAVGAASAAGSRKVSEKIATRNAEIARALIANGGLKQIPLASDATRKITESLMRRGTAASAQ